MKLIILLSRSQVNKFGNIDKHEARVRSVPASRKVHQPLKGAQGASAIEGANAPYEDWLRQCFYPHSLSNTKRTSHERGSYTLPEFVPKKPGFPDLAQ